MEPDIDELWDFDDPERSERRFRHLLERASGDRVLILRTQVARTLGLRKRFAEAHAELDAVETHLAESTSAEPGVRVLLERGRALRSAGRAVEAAPLFSSAFTAADHAGFEGLAADALHMLALVADSPEEALAAGQRVVDYARAAHGSRARRWAGPALNNMGVALRSAGRLSESLEAFVQALGAFEELGDPAEVRVARWQVANLLRLTGRADEALAAQLRLADDCEAAGHPDPYVFEELAALFDERGDGARAERYRALSTSLRATD